MSRDAEPKIDPKLSRLFDKRTVERNIKKGLVTRKDYEKYIKTLDDAGTKGSYGSVEKTEEAQHAEGPAEDDAADDEPEANTPGD